MGREGRFTESDIKSKVKEFIKDNFLVDTELKGLGNDDSFFEKKIIDSTGVLELVSFIEEAFDFKVQDDDLVPDNLDSVNKIASFVTSKKT
jgi:acyl carrier protein